MRASRTTALLVALATLGGTLAPVTEARATEVATPGASLALAVPDWTPAAPRVLATTPSDTGTVGLNPERASVLLRSLTVPGWGQATVGHRGSAMAFFLVELGVWTSYSAFRIQSSMRTDSYVKTAQIQAGIDLTGRDEEYRRIVGSYISSDEYNQLVVFRDAANLYYDNPTAYRQYIAEHSIGGTNGWSWNSESDLIRYRTQRKDAQRAAIRANTALAVGVVNRLVSALHAARLHEASVRKSSWNFEVTPAPAGDAMAFTAAIRARF